MLKDLFNCDYQASKQLLPMNCRVPVPLMKPNFNDLQQIKDIKIDSSDFIKKTIKQQINLLINPFEIKIGDKWYCYAGYGGDHPQTKQCPICKGILYAEASVLHIRDVQIIRGIHVPILLCGNCKQALKYTEHYYLCLDRNLKEIIQEDLNSIELLKNKLNSSEPLLLCFDMYGNEKKEQVLDMTFAHRKIILSLIESKTQI